MSYGLVVSQGRTVVVVVLVYSLAAGTAKAPIGSCRERSAERCRKRMLAMLARDLEIDLDR